MLQFVEHDQFYEGNPSIILNWDGFEIPICDEKPELKVFNVKTFYTFIKNRSTVTLCRPVNDFFATLSVDDQREIASTMVMCNVLLKQQANLPQDVYDVILPECSDLVNELDLAIDLSPKVQAFIDKCIQEKIMPMADMSTAGQRPQDREDMTFYEAEAKIITGLTLLSKIFAPLTGEFIYRHTALINGTSKETFAIRIFSQILKRRFNDIMQKLTYYIGRLVTNKAKNDIALHYRGYTPEYTARIVTDTIFVKKFVSIDLYKPDGSTIKYIASCSKSFVESQSKNGSYIYNIKVFADPKDGDAMVGNEETNSSRVEMEATSSRKPAVVQPLADYGAHWIVESYLKSGEIDVDMFHQALDYYNDYPMLLTPISLIVLGNYFGPELGGGKSIYLVEARNMARLTTLMQCITVKQKSKYLVHALTMGVSVNERVGDITDFTFTNSWKASVAYTDLRKAVTPGYGEITWDQVLKNINQMLTSKPLIYHTAPAIWDGIRKENNLSREEYPNKDGTLYTDRYELMLEIMELFKSVWKEHKLPEED